MTKTRVGIFFGGKSAEHEVSIQSAKNVLEAMDSTKYEPVLVGIDKSGNWHKVEADALFADQSAGVIEGAQSIDRFSNAVFNQIDVALPVMHGPMGEDGTIQGLFELVGLPYVGPGVLASAAGMDKDVMKRLLRDADIQIAPYTVLQSDQSYDESSLIEEFGPVVFVKPGNMGSSIGVSQAKTEQELAAAIKTAFLYDTKILIERAIDGDEIECAVLGNEEPEVSVVGRIVPKTDAFYSYGAKYVDDNGAQLEIPAGISADAAEKARSIALRVYQTIGCQGLARVDMFLTPAGNIVVNEINTLPGFTKISMYPKLWEASGVPYSELVAKLIELAFQRHGKRQSIKTSA